MERYNLGNKMFWLVNVYLEVNGLKVNCATITDATIISAPSSTKNKDKARDPEMRQMRMGSREAHADNAI